MPAKSPKPHYDWLKLEQEFVTGDHGKETLDAFFKEKNISPNTFKRNAVGWHDKRLKFRRQIIEKANEKIITKRSTAISRNSRMGRMGALKTFRAFLKRDLNNVEEISAKELADITEKFVKIEQEAMSFEKLTNIPGGLTFGVQIEETIDGRTISVLAQALTDATTSVRKGSVPPVGE